MNERQCRNVYGQHMEACPKCGGYNMKYQMPIKFENLLPEEITEDALFKRWVQAKKGSATPVEGHCYMMCFDCFHKSPAIDCSGRTSEEVGQDVFVAGNVKYLWNKSARHRGVWFLVGEYSCARH